jgi:hypothetical protein
LSWLARVLASCLIATDDPDAFTAEPPTAILVRQVLGAVTQCQLAMSRSQ